MSVNVFTVCVSPEIMACPWCTQTLTQCTLGRHPFPYHLCTDWKPLNVTVKIKVNVRLSLCV